MAPTSGAIEPSALHPSGSRGWAQDTGSHLDGRPPPAWKAGSLGELLHSQELRAGPAPADTHPPGDLPPLLRRSRREPVPAQTGPGPNPPKPQLVREPALLSSSEPTCRGRATEHVLTRGRPVAEDYLTEGVKVQTAGSLSYCENGIKALSLSPDLTPGVGITE